MRGVIGMHDIDHALKPAPWQQPQPFAPLIQIDDNEQPYRRAQGDP